MGCGSSSGLSPRTLQIINNEPPKKPRRSGPPSTNALPSKKRKNLAPKIIRSVEDRQEEDEDQENSPPSVTPAPEKAYAGKLVARTLKTINEDGSPSTLRSWDSVRTRDKSTPELKRRVQREQSIEDILRESSFVERGKQDRQRRRQNKQLARERSITINENLDSIDAAPNQMPVGKTRSMSMTSLQ